MGVANVRIAPASLNSQGVYVGGFEHDYSAIEYRWSSWEI